MLRTAFFIRLISIVTLLHVYIGMRLIPALSIATPFKWLAALLLVASILLIPLGMAARSIKKQPLSDRLAWVGLLMMGVFSLLLVLTVLRDMVFFLLQVVFRLQGITPIAMAEFTATSALCVPLFALLLTLLGVYNARRNAPVKMIDVPIAGLATALNGFKIVQISDIHIGPTIKRGYVEKIVATVNALKPDLIAVTGDVVDGSVSQLEADARPLGALSARHGTFFVTGNHEYYAGAETWIVEFRRLGFTVLMNQHVVINHDGARAIVAGVTDYSGGNFDPAHTSDPHKALHGAPHDILFRLLLAHQPRSAPAASAAGFTLQLSGHTHGGQFLPWQYVVRLQQPFVHGLSKLNDLWVYTSRGTGYWGPPIRLAAPSEVTLLRLVTATSTI
ncbi:metallophosphoesterase [Acerihabitans sp. TG2]|uniref:metallophosphoesterase n=1 Tax=Acerihabitans sp. TG2 TaxID=3096008 RepID=UPI002B236D75|nr:metallophosphoesterase [Acerihabitans sp. TG2]MEA9391568.1 metallophosphoesterase [Acerihabitans sp. TG2]